MDDLISFDTSPTHDAMADLPSVADQPPGGGPSEANPLSLMDVASPTAAPEPTSEQAAFHSVLSRPRQQVYLGAPPLVEGWMKNAKQKQQPVQQPVTAQRGRACLVLSHSEQSLDGVLQATCDVMGEFASGSEGYLFEVREPPNGRPFLYIETPSQLLAATCLDEARTAAANIIDDKSGARLDPVLIEPPTAPLESLRIRLAHGRPQLLPIPTSLVNLNGDRLQKTWLDTRLRQELTCALKKAGRIKDRVTLRVHLGHLLLRAFPPQPGQEPGNETSLVFEAFQKVVRRPRTRPGFVTQIGNLGLALRVLQAIRSNSDAFCSEDMAVALADVQPEYYFDAEASEWHFHARLCPWTLTAAEVKRGKKPFEVAAVQAVKIAQKTAGSQLQFKCLGLEESFDWMIDTVPEAPVRTEGFDILNSELRAADIQFPNAAKASDRDFPQIRFRGRNEKAKALGKVAMRSIFRFRYRPAPYQIEVTITRQWENVSATAGQPVTTFGVEIYGEGWGNTRASELTKTGQGWGQELEHLFDSQQNELDADLALLSGGEQRAQCLINTIHDIRRALSA